MNKFKFTPKIALIIALSCILLVGIFLLARVNKNKSTSQDSNSSGLLDFFGNRKNVKTNDTTVPGVNTGSGSGSNNTGGDTDGNTNGGVDAGNTSNDIDSKSLALQSIGSLNGSGSSSGNTSGGSTAGGTGGSGSGTGFDTSGGDSGSGSGGFDFTSGSGSGGQNSLPIEQVDCTPKQLPYTQDEIDQLRALTSRFYRIAATLHTEVDVNNEQETRRSYKEIYDKVKGTDGMLMQCEAEKKDSKYTNLAKDTNPRWHPYLNNKLIDSLLKASPMRSQKIAEGKLYKEQLEKIPEEIAALKAISPQTKEIEKSITLAIEQREEYLKKLPEMIKVNSGQQWMLSPDNPDKYKFSADILTGAFFPELKNKDNIPYIDKTRPAGNYDRRVPLYMGIKDFTIARDNTKKESNNQSIFMNRFYCGDFSCGWADSHPFKWLLVDEPKTTTRTVHMLQDIEDALGIW